MTKRVNGILFIYAEKSGTCSECGKRAELRPYGKDEARICFECFEKSGEEGVKRAHQMMFAEEKRSSKGKP